MSSKNNKKLIFGALSAVVASVAAGALVKNNINKKLNDIKDNKQEKHKEKKSKNVYYTVHLDDIYSPYEDKTFSEDDMIEEIRRETSL